MLVGPRRSLASLEAISGIAGIGVNALGAVWRGQHCATDLSMGDCGGRDYRLAIREEADEESVDCTKSCWRLKTWSSSLKFPNSVVLTSPRTITKKWE